jgi:hypothetical protein
MKQGSPTYDGGVSAQGAPAIVDASTPGARPAPRDAGAGDAIDSAGSGDSLLPPADAGPITPSTVDGITDRSLWSHFDATTVDPLNKGYDGAVFDGRYVYFVPLFNEGYSGLVLRYDTQGAFDTAASWTNFDIAALEEKATGYRGATLDGRYAYFVPNHDGSADAVAARFDTLGEFTDEAAWSVLRWAVPVLQRCKSNLAIRHPSGLH